MRHCGGGPPNGAWYVEGSNSASVTSINAMSIANATVSNFKITANTPPVGVLPGSTNQAISNVTLTEFQTGLVGPGTYTTCSGAEDGVNCTPGSPAWAVGTFSNTSHPTFSVTGGGASVNPVVTVANGELTFTG